MMENTTDRLFWTLTSIIIGALILTIGVNAFPKATQGVIQPISGITRQADTTTKTADSAASTVMSNGNSSNNNNNNSNSNNSSSSQSSTPTDPDAQAKANAVDVDNVSNMSFTNNGDGTATLTNLSLTTSDNAAWKNNTLAANVYYNIPEYITMNGQLLKVTNIGNSALYNIVNYASQLYATTGGNPNSAMINVNIPDSINPTSWNANIFGSATATAKPYTNVNFTMSNNELNAIIPNSTSVLNNQSLLPGQAATSQFPIGVYVNGKQNGIPPFAYGAYGD